MTKSDKNVALLMTALVIGVDYSTISQGRKRLREKIEKDRKLKQLVDRIERRLSKGKN